MPQQPGNLSGRCRKTGVCSINLEIPLSYFEKSRGPTGMEKSPSQRTGASPGTSSLTAVALPFSGPPSVCLCEKFYSSYTTYTTLQGREHYLCGMYTRGRHASRQACRGCGRVQSRATRLTHAERPPVEGGNTQVPWLQPLKPNAFGMALATGGWCHCKNTKSLTL